MILFHENQISFSGSLIFLTDKLGTNNVLRLNQATWKVPLLFWEDKLRKLMCIQQFLMLLNQQASS